VYVIDGTNGVTSDIKNDNINYNQTINPMKLTNIFNKQSNSTTTTTTHTDPKRISSVNLSSNGKIKNVLKYVVYYKISKQIPKHHKSDKSSPPPYVGNIPLTLVYNKVFLENDIIDKNNVYIMQDIYGMDKGKNQQSSNTNDSTVTINSNENTFKTIIMTNPNNNNESKKGNHIYMYIIPIYYSIHIAILIITYMI
jgi:hypothetical protein